MMYSCKIESSGIYLNGEQLDIPFNGDADWKKELYQYLKLDYPKFYKMDALSKMATLGVALLKRKVNFDQFGEDGLSLIFANSGSSSATDNKFISSYERSGNPSPSLFVYTLPNIVTGELSIRNKWYGENIFLISDTFSAELYLEQMNAYFTNGAKACLCAWVENIHDQEECVLFLIEKGDQEINKEEITTIYTQ